MQPFNCNLYQGKPQLSVRSNVDAKFKAEVWPCTVTSHVNCSPFQDKCESKVTKTLNFYNFYGTNYFEFALVQSFRSLSFSSCFSSVESLCSVMGL